ncbi:MAG: hypothetical protein JNL49_05985 [Bacteroidia bacterium]|nr:hypothetical protein [Bacteroidia bacterium]
MKKLTPQNLRYQKKHSRKEFRKNVKRKNRKYSGNDIVLKNRYDSKIGNYVYEGPHYVGPKRIYFKDLIAPKIFNLQYENCEKVIEYINKVKLEGKSGHNLNIVLEDITDIGEGAIAMLLSVLEELRAEGIYMKGAKPRDSEAKDILEKSGFLKNMETQLDEKNLNSKNTILKTQGIGELKVNIVGEIRKANETVWGETGRNPPLRGTVFEMMRNSSDHAFGPSRDLIWHFAISHDESENRVKFSFVDNGKGIINSLKTTTLSSVLRIFKDNADILETAFKDGIESRTGLRYRGKGLPTIFENYQERYFENLVVISNDVFLDFDKQIYKTLNVRFRGTYYYWRMSRNCVKACYN